jgi:hypothetical protein
VLTVPQRLAQLKDDPWAGYAVTGMQTLTAAMRRALGG